MQRGSGTRRQVRRSALVQRRGPAAYGGRATVSEPVTRLTPRRGESQKRTPPVRMNVLPPPISPRASANGVIVPFTLNVVPPSRFSPALVAEMLVPPDGPADACAMFRPPPAYGRSALLVGTRNR